MPKERTNPQRAVYAVDVGSTRGKTGGFGWYRDPSGIDAGETRPDFTSIDSLVSALQADIRAGTSIALGFEAPTFMPVPTDSHKLSAGRSNEGNRSMFAPAGASVTTLGMHQAAFILRSVRTSIELAERESQTRYEYSLEHERWSGATSRPCLLLWEAFVSGAAKTQLLCGAPELESSHVRDACAAVQAFLEFEPSAKADTTMVAVDGDAFCMLHAVALWAGLATDLERLHGKCLVLRPGLPALT